MKRIISIFLVLGMLVTTLCVPSIASAEDTYYINATFEEGTTNPFTASRNRRGSEGTSEVVNAATEGVGTSGKVLKISTGSTTTDYVVEAPLSSSITTSPIVMEARFLTTGLGGVSRLFTVNNTGRNREYGLIALRKNANLSTTNAPMFVGQEDNSTVQPLNGTNINGYLVGENGAPVEFAANTWYKVKMIYNTGATTNVIGKLYVYDDSDNLIASATNISHNNDSGYPVPSISCLGFGQLSWGNNDALYIDDVKVYDYVAPAALALSSNTVTAGTTVTIPFTQDLDADTLDNISITGIDAANPVITSKSVSGKNLVLTFEESLTPDAMYTLNLTGLYSTLETTMTDSTVILKTKPTPANIHLDVNFDNGTSPFTTFNNNNGGAAVVDAATEGVGTSGKVLKITSGTNNDFIATTNLASNIGSSSPVVMEARFRSGSDVGINRLFAIYSSATSRNRPYGLATVRKTGVASYPIMFALEANDNDAGAFSGTATNGYLVDSNTSPLAINKNTWYKVKIVYEPKATTNVMTMYVFNDENNLIHTSTNLSHANDAQFALQDIAQVGFGSRAWGTAETLYVDDVYIYDYEASTAFSFVDSNIVNGAEVSPIEAKEITLDFNNRILKSSLSGIAVTVGGSPVAHTAELSGDSTKVKITITDAINAGNYVIDYSAVKDVNYASVAGTLPFSVKSGKFVESIAFDRDTLTTGTIGATVNIVNSTGSASTVTVFAALYSTEEGANRLIDITPVFDYTVAAGNTPVPVTITVPAGTALASSKVQVMVLESISTLKPLSAAKWLTTAGTGVN